MVNITKTLTRTQKLSYPAKSSHFDTQLKHRNPARNGGVLPFLEDTHDIQRTA